MSSFFLARSRGARWRPWEESIADLFCLTSVTGKDPVEEDKIGRHLRKLGVLQIVRAFAEATSSARTSADIIEIRPIAHFTTSLESSFS